MKTFHGVTAGFMLMAERFLWQLKVLRSISDGTTFDKEENPYGALEEIQKVTDKFIKEWEK